jgi:DNA-binding transcriptional ArsR family regulator
MTASADLGAKWPDRSRLLPARPLAKDGDPATFNRMVDHSSPDLDRIFFALSDPTRRAMLSLLAGEASSVTALADHFAGRMSLAAASKHIKVLESAALLRRSVQGRVHLCRLNAEPLQAAESWMSHYARFWDDRLDALDDMLASGEDHEGDD